MEMPSLNGVIYNVVVKKNDSDKWHIPTGPNMNKPKQHKEALVIANRFRRNGYKANIIFFSDEDYGYDAGTYEQWGNDNA